MGLGPEDLSLHTDKVTDVKPLQVQKGLLPKEVFSQVSLDPSLSILEMDELGLPKIPAGDDPPGETERFLMGLQFFIRHGPEGPVEILGGMGDPEIVRIGIDALLSQFLEFPDPLLHQFADFFHPRMSLMGVFLW